MSFREGIPVEHYELREAIRSSVDYPEEVLSAAGAIAWASFMYRQDNEPGARNRIDDTRRDIRSQFGDEVFEEGEKLRWKTYNEIIKKREILHQIRQAAISSMLMSMVNEERGDISVSDFSYMNGFRSVKEYEEELNRLVRLALEMGIDRSEIDPLIEEAYNNTFVSNY